jgi:hypothetical protein
MQSRAVGSPSDRIGDEQSVSKRCSVMRALRADGEQLSGVTHEQGRLATDMACHYAAFGDIGRGYALSEIESGW